MTPGAESDATAKGVPPAPPARGACAIRTFTLGPFETNCYVVTAPDERTCWIVDAGFEPRELIEFVRASALAPAAVVLTHAHVDHIAGVKEVRGAFPDVPVWVHENEREWLSSPLLNLSEMMGLAVTAPGPDRILRGGETLGLGGSRWSVLNTPGHSPGGITLHNEAEGVALVGDSLFAGSVGRMDFPGGDEATLVDSIRRVLYRLPDETKVYPGHGPPTTIGREKRTNPFVRA